MLGAIIGDIVGSFYESKENRDKDVNLFPEGAGFTDHSVMGMATAEAILEKKSFENTYRAYGKKYPEPLMGYGERFGEWLTSDDPKPYGSWGSGSAVRSAPIGFAYDDRYEVLEEAKKSAACTHSHPEGIKGAQAVAAAICLARKGLDKEQIRKWIEKHFGYDLHRRIKDIRGSYRCNESSQGTVPEAILCVLDSEDFEDAIRNAISIEGHTRTLACIAGGFAQAFYTEIPDWMIAKSGEFIPKEFQKTIDTFNTKFEVSFEPVAVVEEE